MNNSETQIIEINGVKMEVDMRHARVIHQNLRIGTKVKILVRSTYYEPKVYPGVIVGFQPFNDLPTITVAYLNESSEDFVQFAYINNSAKSAEQWSIVPDVDDDLPILKGRVIDALTRQIEKKRREIEDLIQRKKYFLDHFSQYFPETETASV